MNESANVSGAFMRPSLIDYLLVAEEDHLRVDLFVYVGRLELGIIGVEAGRVIYADLPGSTGDSAFALLSQMPGTRVEPAPASGHAPNLTRPWRELIADERLSSSPGRAWRLEHVRAEIEDLAEISAGELIGALDQDHDLELLAAVGELLDWAASDACLREDNERAHALLTLREELCPTELVCAANLERLHLRLLEDEITSTVMEATQ